MLLSVIFYVYAHIMYLIVSDAKKKWRNLRDTFVKKRKEYKDRTPSGAGALPEPSWIWYRQMEWLMPYLSTKS